VWEPIYLACPGGFKLPVVLTNIASLISGSTRGVVTKRPAINQPALQQPSA
jgi:lysylphosphatidylglycerol synthetase-like protein (DUF2156 family)